MYTILHTHVGVSESFDDQMRSILAQLEYRHTINMYEEGGVPFRTYMYVLEAHPATNVLFCEREDDAHLLKVKNLFDCIKYILYLLLNREWLVIQEMVAQNI